MRRGEREQPAAEGDGQEAKDGEDSTSQQEERILLKDLAPRKDVSGGARKLLFGEEMQ